MKKVIVFDYDGVIVDSYPLEHKIYQYACKKFGNTKCPQDFATFKQQHNNDYERFNDLLGFTRAQKQECSAIFSKKAAQWAPPLFPGIKKVVKELSETHKLVLATGNYKSVVTSKLKSSKMFSFFDAVMGKETIQIHELPKHMLYSKIMRDHNVKQKQLISIGDRAIDYREAKKARIKNILLVEYGWGYRKEEVPRHKQKVVIEKPQDIMRAVKKV